MTTSRPRSPWEYLLSGPATRNLAAAASLGLVLAIGAACDGSEDPGPDPSPSATGTPGSGSPTPSDEPSAEPSAEAATGPLLKMPEAQVRAPEGWVKADGMVPTISRATPPEGISAIRLGSIDAFGATPSLDELAQNTIMASLAETKPKKQPNVEIDGKEVYHLSGPTDERNYLDQYGVVYKDRIVTLEIDLDTKYVSEAERAEIVESVLASFTWK